MAIAGGGAQEQARRAAARAADLRRQLESAQRRQQAWEAGAAGERLVAAELTRLEASGWVVVHDVRWQGRPRANLDHVLVGPGGVVVVDTKNWSGPVSVRDGVLRAGSWRKDAELEGVARAVADVAALVEPALRPPVRGVLCLVQHDVPAHRTVSGVAVVGRSQIVEAVLRLPGALTPADVARVSAELSVALDAVRPAMPKEPRVDLRPADGHQPFVRARSVVRAVLVLCLLVLLGLAATGRG